MRTVHCLCCGRQFRMAAGGQTELAKHVLLFHTDSGAELKQVLLWMIEDGAFEIVERWRAAA